MASLLKEWMTSSPSATTTHIQSNNKILILNGGVSTYLETILQKPFVHRCLWSSSLLLHTCPDDEKAIRTCHSDFYSAGSDIITTVTYQCSHAICNSTHLHSSSIHLSQEDVDEMLLYGLQLACETQKQFMVSDIQRHLYVVASVGCYGAALANGAEYTGDYRISQRMTFVEDLIQFHQRRYRILTTDSRLMNRGIYPDGVAFETIPCLDEVRAIGMLLQQDDDDTTRHAVWISLACKDGEHMNDGTPLEIALDVIDELDPNGKRIHGIGINCFHIRYLSSLVHILVAHIVRKKVRRVIIFYPNSGEEWDPTSSQWVDGSGCTVAHDFATRIVQDGLSTIYNYLDQHGHDFNIPIIVGGCCRTYPATICEIRKQVQTFQEQRNAPSR